MEWSEHVTEALKNGWLEVSQSGATQGVQDEWWDACTYDERPFIVFRTSKNYGAAHFDMFTCQPGMRNKLNDKGIAKIKHLHQEYLTSLSTQQRKLLSDARKRAFPGEEKRLSDNVYGPGVGQIIIRREDQSRFMLKLTEILSDQRHLLSERVHGLRSIQDRAQT